MTLTGALSSYDIPPQTGRDESMPRWLSTCISEAAKHLDQAPFLQLLVSSGTQAFERHRVTTAVVQVRSAYYTFGYSTALLLRLNAHAVARKCIEYQTGVE